MAKQSNISNYHVQYLDVQNQHWHAGSERYAGGDQLVTALDRGWTVARCAEAKHYYAGMRFVRIFNFKLHKEGQEMTMPVVDNPYVVRFIDEEEIELIREDQTA